MGYVIGVSSGIFGAAQPEEKLQYISLSQKAYYAMFKGVNFVQIDLETISEFQYPNLKFEIEKVKKLGMEFGIHGESGHFGGRESPAALDSSLEVEYRRSHERIHYALENSGKLGARYYLIHASETTPFSRLEMDLQPAKLVDIWGRPIKVFLEENPEILDWISEQEWADEFVHRWRIESVKDIFNRLRLQEAEKISRDVEEEIRAGKIPPNKREEEIERRLKEREPELKKRAKEERKKTVSTWLQRQYSVADIIYGPERFAYIVVGEWMRRKKDIIWEGIVKQNLEEFKEEMKQNGEEYKIEPNFEDDTFRSHMEIWGQAVAAKYIWGHFNVDKVEGKKPSPFAHLNFKKILERYKMYFVFEQEMPPKGYEKYIRLNRPTHIYWLVKAINHPLVGIAIDFEHLLAGNINIDKELDKMPEDGGKYVKVLHVGWPTPLAPAHIPIPLGSDQQYKLYEWMWKLRQKGMKDCWVIFERGGGRDPIKQSVLALRKIKEYLEKDVPPEKLPPEFFGFPTSQSLARQKVVIFEHALDPLKGTLMFPEITHTFLGRKAIEKGKRPEEWAKEELK